MTTGTMTIAPMLTRTMERTLGLAQALLEGVRDEDFSSFPQIGSTTVETNHPAFIYGHLSIYPFMVASTLGLDASEIAVPEGFDELFKNGVECVHDPEGKTYPSREAIVSYFTRAHAFVFEGMKGLEDGAFLNGIEGNDWAADFFGNGGTMGVFMLHDHYMFHLGQMSAWRRCMGLGSAM